MYTYIHTYAYVHIFYIMLYHVCIYKNIFSHYVIQRSTQMAILRIFFCKAQAMIAERKILLCKLLSSGESETIEIKPCSTIVYILGVSGKRFRQLTEKIGRRG